MEAVREYMRSIALYMILDAFIGIILSGGKYKKYISLVSGLILILMMANPINNVLRFIKGIKMPQLHKFNKGMISEVCRDAIAKQISAIVHNIGAEASDIQIEINETDKTDETERGQVRAIKINLTKADEDCCEKLREVLAGLYGAERIEIGR